MSKIGVLMVFCLALPASAAQWGRLFYTPQERAAMMNVAASAPVAATVHVFSAKTLADGRLRRWVDAASSPTVRIPPHVRVGETWQDEP